MIDNSASNTVNLFYKDHVLAHYYLALCAKDKKFFVCYDICYKHNYWKQNRLKMILRLDLNSILTALPKYQELYETSIKS